MWYKDQFLCDLPHAITEAKRRRNIMFFDSRVSFYLVGKSNHFSLLTRRDSEGIITKIGCPAPPWACRRGIHDSIGSPLTVYFHERLSRRNTFD